MQQYDLLSRFSVRFEHATARAVIISYSSCGMCPGWVNRIDAAGPWRRVCAPGDRSPSSYNLMNELQ